MTEISPRTIGETAEAVRAAAAEKKALDIGGAGAREALGRRGRPARKLRLSRMRAVTAYEPSELVLTCEAGAPLDELESLLAERGQMFPFEPPDPRRMLDGSSAGTIGGAIATGLGGPRRPFAGAPRDFMLGVAGVTGKGEAFKAGGRVVKNVTGFDLPRLMAGSFGTLAAMTEVTLKVLPRPFESQTLRVRTETSTIALSLLAAARRSQTDPSGLSFVPRHDAAFIRLEGTRAGVRERAAALKTLIGREDVFALEREEADDFWRDVRDGAPLVPDEARDRPLWRATLPPAAAQDLCDRVGADLIAVDWGGGLFWIASDDPPPTPAAAWTLVRRGMHDRNLPAFSNVAPEVAALSRRLKGAFDPDAVLNPRRLFEGF